MKQTGSTGSRAFLEGLDNKDYGSTSTDVTDSKNRPNVEFSQTVIDACNYYGIYPSTTQTSTRALKNDLLQTTYNLHSALNVFNPVLDLDSGQLFNPGTLYTHGTSTITGSFWL
jgi:hypothetical protein